MRDLDERMEEISRRSQIRINQIKKRRIGMLTACIPVVLCAALFVGFGGESKDNAAHAPGEAWKPEIEENFSVADKAFPEQDNGHNHQVPTQLAYGVQYIRTDGYAEGAKYPCITVIDSVRELDSYYKSNKNTFDLERKEKVCSDTTIGFLDACDRYDERFFESRYLVLVLLEEGSGSVRHKVTGVEPADDGIKVKIQRNVPEIGTDDMAQWHIIMEMKRDGKPVGEAQVLVEFQ